MQSEEMRRQVFLKNREKMKERRKSIENSDLDYEQMTTDQMTSTISLESLQEQLQTLKHEINIETIQEKLRIHEVFFKELGDDKELLFDIIRLYKQKRELKNKVKL
ncbi:hypothetical protein KKA14_22210 [bacterium]|nr:hypothetical protein [bacterium]